MPITTSGAASSSIIKSLQTFTIALADPDTSGTATITSVDTARYLLIPLGQTTDNINAQQEDSQGRFILTNATTVTFSRVGTTGALTGYGMIVEFYS